MPKDRSSDGTVRLARPSQQKRLTTTLDAEAVVSGARGVGHGASMFSVRDAGMERRPT